MIPGPERGDTVALSGKVHSLTLSPTPFCTYRSLSLLLSLVTLVHSTEVAQLGTSTFSGTPPAGQCPSHSEQGAARGPNGQKAQTRVGQSPSPLSYPEQVTRIFRGLPMASYRMKELAKTSACCFMLHGIQRTQNAT